MNVDHDLAYKQATTYMKSDLLIPGFRLYPDFITESIEEDLIHEIDSQLWIVDYDRRLQYYGYRNELEAPYDLVKIPVPIPEAIKILAEQIHKLKYIDNMPDQVIINEYNPGQGIRPHKDRNYFENQICGVNLGSDCIMQFIKVGSKEKVNIHIPRRSIYVMQDEARYKYKHAIPPRKKDIVDDKIIQRDRRISITYRKVKPQKVKPILPDGKVATMLKNLYKIGI